MIQDIAPHEYHVAYENVKPRPLDTMLIYKEGGILCREVEGKAHYPLAEDIEQVYPDVLKAGRYLFTIDEIRYFDLPEETLKPFGSWQYMPKDKIRQMRPIWKAFAGITGFQLHNWYGENKFCGNCGNKMVKHKKERAMTCPSCGHVSYPQICPSVIVAITDGDKLLMTKYAGSHSSFQRYALVAGYNEIGESLEDTVRREVMEEVGLRVKNIRYYKSQPWSFSGALLVGFICEVDGSRDIVLDREELSVAEWFKRGEMPKERSNAEISLTGEMMQAFEDGFF